MRLASLTALAFALAAPAAAHEKVSDADRLLHEQMLVLDTHLDTPVLFERPGWDFTRWHEYAWDNSQVDVPRMEAAGLDGGFFVIYTAQGGLDAASMNAARNAALQRAAAIQRVVAANPDKLAFATTAADAERIHKQGKRIVFQSIENSYPLGNDVSLLQHYYQLGVRMAGPVHNGNNQFADSARPKPGDKTNGGLSALGRAWVAEMNRLGMIVDGSHSSDATIEQMITLSKAPIILSHHGPKAIFDHPRNIDDALMRRLARSGGVMFVNTLFLRPTTSSDARDSIEERQKQWETLSEADRRKLVAERTATHAKEPFAFADFDLFMRSMLNAISVMGVDHVGIGADWDGGGGLTNMQDIVPLPLIGARLRKEGFSEADIAKIMGGNLLRVMRAVEKQAAR
ncbi:MAG TPA: dipeptidase [Allosphingosinicella sp.]|jgi:membrane dipeptidase